MYTATKGIGEDLSLEVGEMVKRLEMLKAIELEYQSPYQRHLIKLQINTLDSYILILSQRLMYAE